MKKELLLLIGLRHSFEAASKYDRAIAVIYDLYGLKATGEDCSALIEDWKFLVAIWGSGPFPK